MQQNFYSNPAMGSAAGTWGPQAFPGTYNYMGARPQVQMPVFSNPMTEEEHKLLLNDGGFNTTRNKLDVIRDMCTHKHNGQICVFERPDHLVQCSYCGKVWEMKDNYTHEDVENLVEEIVSVIETIKTFLPSVSPDLARQLFAALGMIELIPSMFDYAMDTLNKMKNATGGIMPNQSSDYANTLNALWGLTGAVTPGMPQYGNYMASQLYNQFGAPAQPWGGAAAPAGAPMPGQPWMGGPAPAGAPMQMGTPAQPWMGGAPSPAGAPMQMGTPAQPWWTNTAPSAPTQPGAPVQPWGATPAGAPMDKPVGVVTPNAGPMQMGGPAPMPGTTVTQNQVATTGPAPMQATQANVPPATPAPTGDAPAKSFKA